MADSQLQTAITPVTTVAPTTTVAPVTTVTTPARIAHHGAATNPPTSLQLEPITATTVAAPTTTEAPAVTSAAPKPSEGAASPPAPSGSTLLACLRRYESGDGAGSSNTYQFEGATWAAAFAAAIAQGLLDAATPHTTAGAAPAWVQDAAAQAWVNAGHLRQAWAAQRGRCFT